jgi:hypothetical protein
LLNFKKKYFSPDVLVDSIQLQSFGELIQLQLVESQQTYFRKIDYFTKEILMIGQSWKTYTLDFKTYSQATKIRLCGIDGRIDNRIRETEIYLHTYAFTRF